MTLQTIAQIIFTYWVLSSAIFWYISRDESLCEKVARILIGPWTALLGLCLIVVLTWIPVYMLLLAIGVLP